MRQARAYLGVRPISGAWVSDMWVKTLPLVELQGQAARQPGSQSVALHLGLDRVLPLGGTGIAMQGARALLRNSRVRLC